jgi:uncharacterized protein
MKYYQSCHEILVENPQTSPPPFFFKELSSGVILLTNDICNFIFLSQQEFRAFLAEKKNELPESVYTELVDKGFVYGSKPELWVARNAPIYKSTHSYLCQPTCLFIIVLTLDCNLLCQYCQAAANRDKSVSTAMTIATAKKAVERIFSSPANSFTIEFQGGEPLLNFKCLSHIVTYAQDLAGRTGKECRFQITTNLHAMTMDICKFFVENKVDVTVSLDGPSSVHDRNRPSKDSKSNFEVISNWVKWFNKEKIPISALPTISEKSIGYPREIIDEYRTLGFESIFFRPLSPFGRARSSSYSPELFIAFYQEALNYLLDKASLRPTLRDAFAANLFKKIVLKQSVNHMEFRSPCGAAIGQLAIDWNGNVYTCDEARMIAQEGNEAFKIGNVHTDSYEEWIKKTIVLEMSCASCLETSVNCSDCAYQPFCGICPIVNYKTHGSLFELSHQDDWCEIRRGMFSVVFETLRSRGDKSLELFSMWGK